MPMEDNNEKQKYHTVRTVPEYNRQRVETGKLISSKYITLSSQSRLSTGTGGVKLVDLVDIYQISISHVPMIFSPFYVNVFLSSITDKTCNGLYCI
jgi:hypothetical protein